MVRVGVIGTGRMGRIHLESLLRSVSVEVAYVVSGRESSEAPLRASFPGLFSDPRHNCRFLGAQREDDLFEDAGVEAVVIASPTADHARQVGLLNV